MGIDRGDSLPDQRLSGGSDATPSKQFALRIHRSPSLSELGLLLLRGARQRHAHPFH
jgi:hypothetical protein